MEDPVKTKTLLDLKTVVSDPSLISFTTTSLQSETALTCQTLIGADKYVIRLNPRNPSQRDQHKMGADLVAPHPKSNILALKGGPSIQVYNFDIGSRLKSFKMTENVVYMKWLDISTLALVTTNGVYHCTMDAESIPELVFQRLPQLEGYNIINYRADANKNWLMLQGSMVDPTTQRLIGAIQVYNVSKKKSQFLPGNAGMFIQGQLMGKQVQSNLMVMAVNNKLLINELDVDAPAKMMQDIRFLDDKDVPIAMEYSTRFGLIFVISAMGLLSAYDIGDAALVLMSKVSPSLIFSTISEETENGVIGINQQGQVLSITVNPNTLVPFITQKLKNVPLAVRIASRANLTGTEELFTEQFEAAFAAQNYQEAARVVASSPGGALRTAQTIQRFKAAAPIPGQALPIMQYLALLLDKGKLNERESLELLIPVMQQGHKEMVQKWMQEGKISASEELGNFLRQYDIQLALIIYLQSKSHEKVAQIYCELGEYENVIKYCKSNNYKAPYTELLRGVCQINPAGSEQFCKLLYDNAPEGPLIDIGEAMEILFQFDLIKELTGVMVGVLAKNEPTQAKLQTRYLEILLLKRPDVANALFEKRLFTEYDQAYIAHCCEKAGLYNRALEHYDALPDILRCIVFTNKMTMEFVTSYIHDVSEQRDVAIGTACLKQLTKNKANLPLCVEVCKKCTGVIDPKEMITILEQGGMVEAVYLYLQGVAATIEDKELVFRFIQSAVKTGQIKDVERVVRESKWYDPKEVKDLLKESKIEPTALMIVCDRYGYVDELVKYLYHNNLHKAIERYVTGFNAKATPVVVGTLLDVEANEEFINSLLGLVKNECPIDQLVEECERRNRLRILQPFLEARVSEDGNTDPACHSALAKIYVETNTNADQFLTDNQFYDSLVVGKFCEKRDPRRAVICYRRGKCDQEMIQLTNNNSLFKEQAKYLVERRDKDLWAQVLNEENPNRRAVIDQVTSSALPACKNPNEVSDTVKAFVSANLPNELIELLEVIMLRKSDFSSNRNLQNLLLITAIKAGSNRVKEYIQRLDNYDGIEVAKFALSSGLNEEAFEMYKKFDHHKEAIGVLLDQIDDVERAYDYAVAVNTKECWSLVAKGQLDRGMVEKSIDSYLRAEDPNNYHEVISAARDSNLYGALVKYLKMARVLKEQLIDSELVYAYAKIDALAEIEEFISQSNQADLDGIGERCFDEQMYNAARILFNHIGNYARLASTLVCLGQYQGAVDAARKAQSIRTWKEVCFACVDAHQFRLAQMCGVNIVVQADELEELVQYYTDRGRFEEVISLLEYAMRLERTHMGMFTELGILYSRFKPEKLMEHIKLFHSKINIAKMLTVCEQNLQWSELCVLYCHYDEYDSAATKMMEHIDAWNHAQFKDIIQKVTNMEIFYRAIDVYLKQHPTLLCDLLSVMAPRIDNTRVVSQLRRSGMLALIKPYLLFVQSSTKPEIPEVNEAVNDLYLEEEDVDSLRASIENYPTFDQLGLSRRLEAHPLLRMRRLATWLYTKNKRFAHAVELAKKDQMYQDAMVATAESGDKDVAEELLRFFAMEIEEKDRASCFAACLYTCYEILPPDVVMEVAWIANLRDYAMPYFVNSTKEYVNKVNNLSAELTAMKEQKAKEAEEEAAAKPMENEVITPMMGMSTSGIASMPPQMMMATPPPGYVPTPGGYIPTPSPPYYGQNAMQPGIPPASPFYSG
ncbi:Clathrin heavy chainC [Monocercomonoides exilis]|uniref:Clathrin heavy chainC n=1 Tax=Monocercomonoides exilis TaxID=2049356 RepID=UPI00355A1B20|nr:Clathrin heavy chainC [Monocercomonoides exilis]|eukprot:MONOS_8373.1-p1 / transcript=MONOS_8373.1 / gene=MONOS_8373 / organism=Monocercomonoides_exilis_PA203 / gene_product= Clathrin heavy chain C / transcript_product= Clathrin heavy chain C / location=Mono_scaffold00314:40282-45712(+) / protein_length=1702 / sequence_SO=supercontig / SO=protein_coding / is_pseudo=false